MESCACNVRLRCRSRTEKLSKYESILSVKFSTIFKWSQKDKMEHKLYCHLGFLCIFLICYIIILI